MLGTERKAWDDSVWQLPFPVPFHLDLILLSFPVFFSYPSLPLHESTLYFFQTDKQ